MAHVSFAPDLSVWMALQFEAEANPVFSDRDGVFRHAAHFSDGSVHLTPTPGLRELVRYVLSKLGSGHADRQLGARLRRLGAELGLPRYRVERLVGGTSWGALDSKTDRYHRQPSFAAATRPADEMNREHA
jgi:hypothetical protein